MRSVQYVFAIAAKNKWTSSEYLNPQRSINSRGGFFFRHWFVRFVEISMIFLYFAVCGEYITFKLPGLLGRHSYISLSVSYTELRPFATQNMLRPVGKRLNILLISHISSASSCPFLVHFYRLTFHLYISSLQQYANAHFLIHDLITNSFNHGINAPSRWHFIIQLASGHYVCPTCQTSMIDMTKLWDYLDTQAQNLPVPKSHENSIVDIFCNDCFKVS